MFKATCRCGKRLAKEVKGCCKHDHDDRHSKVESAATWVHDTANVVADKLPKAQIPSIDMPNPLARKKKRKCGVGKMILLGLLSLMGLGAIAFIIWWQQGA